MAKEREQRSETAKTVAIVYGRVAADAPQDEQDILLDVDFLARVIESLGYRTLLVPASLDLSDMLKRLQDAAPLIVFNMIESLGGHDRLIHLPPAVFEAFQIPFTGVSAMAHFCTTDKIFAKRMFQLAGIPTPQWQRCDAIVESGIQIPLPCIVKPIASDASKGMDEHSVCMTAADLNRRVKELSPVDLVTYFAEQFIEGREFNLSMLSTADGVRVLPPAEMTFVDYPSGKPAIVDYKAKWAPESFEYSHTVRRFDFADADAALIEQLHALSLRCWSLFELTGYARVDFRVDAAGKPWVLEINGNPCISPDAGFVAAAARAGMSFEQIIRAIIDDVYHRITKAEKLSEQRRARRRAVNTKR